ncbi:FecR family protein [Pseudodesulfovibrio karagichevae]|uniref:FecR domain-containing protein n=1 Tax=Pseudodesulfovibrio karagichevae TaxID=3239305 RepID=A0ABV4K7G2_9BACT
MSKIHTVLQCCLLAAVLISIAPAAVRAMEPAPALPDAIGEVVSLAGTVTAQGADGAVRKLGLNHPVAPRDVIVTGSHSNVEILFHDRSVLSQGPDSRTAIDDFVYAADPSASKILLKVGTGTFRYVTGQIVRQNPDAFALDTPTTTIGIRGTEVFAENTAESEEIGVLSMTPGHEVDVSSGGVAKTISRAGYSVMSVGGRLSDPAPTDPATRARVMKAAPQTTQGESAAPGRSDIDSRVRAFAEAIGRTKGGLGSLEDRPDYNALHNITLQTLARDNAERGRDGSVGAGLGSGGDGDGGDGGGQP